MSGAVDDGIGWPAFLNLAIVQNDDIVGDLRHNGQIMRYVDRSRPLVPDHFLECLENFDLGCHIQGGRRFVKDKQVRTSAQRHGSHQSLQLATGDLMRITRADGVWIR